MVRRGVPGKRTSELCYSTRRLELSYQLVKKVILSVDMTSEVGRLQESIHSCPLELKGRPGRACPFAGIVQIKFNGISQIFRLADAGEASGEAVEHPSRFTWKTHL